MFWEIVLGVIVVVIILGAILNSSGGEAQSYKRSQYVPPKNNNHIKSESPTPQYKADTEHHDNLYFIERFGEQINASPLLNKSELAVFFELRTLLSSKELYCHPQVGMASFLRFPSDVAGSIICKRVDFVIVNKDMLPKGVIEVNGTGHYSQSNEAGKRMDVKRLLCRQAGIKLAELHVAHPINRVHIKQQLASIVAEL